MGESSDIHLQRVFGQLGGLVYEMTQIRFSQCAPPRRWSPPLNIYRCENAIVVCADLAGVDKADIHLQAEPRRLLLRGTRPVPESTNSECKTREVLAMEIDYGPFEREVLFPVDVDVERVTAEQRNGFLWIILPFRSNA